MRSNVDCIRALKLVDDNNEVEGEEDVIGDGIEEDDDGDDDYDGRDNIAVWC